MKAAKSAQKAYQGSENETGELLTGNKENINTLPQVVELKNQANSFLFSKSRRKNIVLMIRLDSLVAQKQLAPGRGHLQPQ